MLHDDRMLPSQTVLPQGFHLGGEGAGQTVDIMATWVVASRGSIGFRGAMSEMIDSTKWRWPSDGLLSEFVDPPHQREVGNRG
jgi:hypothetical protein